MGALESWRIASFATKLKFYFCSQATKRKFKAGFDQNKKGSPGCCEFKEMQLSKKNTFNDC